MWHKFIAILPAFFLLYLVKFALFGVPFTLIEGLIYVAFLAFIIRTVSGKVELKDLFCIKFLFRFWIPILLIIIGVIFGIILQNDPEGVRHGFGILKGWIIAPVLYFIVLVSEIKKEEDVALALHSYLFSCAVLGLWAIWQVISGDYITIDQRASAFFNSANYLALYIGPGVLLCGILFFQQKGYFKIIYGGLFLILALALLFSASYAGILAVICGFFVYFFHKIKKMPRRTVGIAITVFAILSGIFIATQRDTYKFKEFLNFEKHSSSSARLQIWTVAVYAIRENPVLGIGPGAFESYYSREAANILGHEPFDKTALHPHNIFMTFWLYSGIVGLIGFIWLIFFALKDKTLLALSILVVILIHGLFDTPFWKNDLALLFWFVIYVSEKFKNPI